MTDRVAVPLCTGSRRFFCQRKRLASMPLSTFPFLSLLAGIPLLEVLTMPFSLFFIASPSFTRHCFCPQRPPHPHPLLLDTNCLPTACVHHERPPPRLPCMLCISIQPNAIKESAVWHHEHMCFVVMVGLHRCRCWCPQPPWRGE